MKTTYIYVLSDGEKYYIGKSDDPEKRLRDHITHSFNPKKKDYWLRKGEWIKSYNSIEGARENIHIFDVIEVDVIEWQDLEIELIASYRRNFGEENVMNMSDGGDTGLS